MIPYTRETAAMAHGICSLYTAVHIKSTGNDKTWFSILGYHHLA